MISKGQSKRNALHASRGIAVINNQAVRFMSFNVEKNGFTAADTFEVNLPFFLSSSNVSERILANGPDFQTALLTNDSIPVQLYVGYPNNTSNYGIKDLTQIMDGYMDTVNWDFSDQGEIITINGRNIVGKMIDNKLVDKFPNMTSSGIAYYFAKKYGLNTKITNTSKLAGNYYNQTSTVMPTTEMSEWDLLIFLSKQENFIVRVKNNTLYFGPYSIVTGYVSQAPIPYSWGKDITNLSIERSPHAARDIIVKVISYDRDSGKRIIEQAHSSTSKASSISGQTGQKQQYIEVYTIPGLNRDQAQKKARSIYEELSRSQIIGQISVSGSLDLEIDRILSLGGLGAGLSANYYLNKVTQSFDNTYGFGTDASFSNQFMPDEDGVAPS